MLRGALRRISSAACSAPAARSFGGALAAAAAAGTGVGVALAQDDDNPFAPGYSAPVPAPPPAAAPPGADDPGPSPWSRHASGSGAASPSAVVPAGMTPQLAAGRNIVLGDQSIPEAQRPHRVALCEWPADQAKHNGEPRTSSPRILMKWLKRNGYDGIECTAGFMASKFFAGMPLDDVAAAAKAAAEQHGMKIFGANVWWCFDCGWEDGSIIQEMREQVRLTKLMGGEYVTFQMWLKPEAMGDCGAYRRDEPYLEECARRIEKLHQLCFEQGMNCYIEVSLPANPPPSPPSAAAADLLTSALRRTLAGSRRTRRLSARSWTAAACRSRPTATSRTTSTAGCARPARAPRTCSGSWSGWATRTSGWRDHSVISRRWWRTQRECSHLFCFCVCSCCSWRCVLSAPDVVLDSVLRQ